MGWYHSSWAHRIDITIDNSSTPSATPDVEIVVPPDLDIFWNNIQSDGDDIRITQADGETLTSYDLSGFSYANKTVTLQVDACTAAATAGCYKLCLYWGYASATDASSAVVIASAKTGYIAQGLPVDPRFRFRPIKPGATNPDDFFLKGTNEQTDIWWNVTDLLRRRAWSQQSRDRYEEAFSIVAGVNQGGASQASMFEQGSSRFLWIKGEQWVSMRVKAGTTANEYTAQARLSTVIPYANGAAMATSRVLESHVQLFVDDAQE